MEGDSMRKKIATMLTLILVAGTYDDPQKYPNGTADENYYCEIWIPVKIPIFGVFTKRQRRVAVYSVSII